MSASQRTIKAAEGRRVRHPGTKKLLDSARETVTWSSYWERLRAAGDVVEVPSAAASEQQKSPPPPPPPGAKTKDGTEQ